MQYEPLKKLLGRFSSGSVFLRKILYFLIDLILLRTWHVKKSLKTILRLFPGDACILDAGSGFGQYAWRMARMNKQWKIKAIDINGQHVEDCKSFFDKTGMSDRVTFEKGDLVKFTEKNSYDFILSVDVMEHIKEDQIVFKNFFNSLKENGIILISTPSDKGGSDVNNESDISFIDEHVRNGYGIREIAEKLSDAGFLGIETKYTYGLPGKISWHLSMKYPIGMLNISRWFIIILPVYYLIFSPFIFLLNIFDLNFTHRTGTGLIIMASK